MSNLLTHQDYQAIASGLTLPSLAFIDGAFCPALSGRTFTTSNPATGAPLGPVAACDAADVDKAVAAARRAFDDGSWSRLHPGARKAVLLRLAELMQENARELAVLESLDSGKTIFDCETVDVPETIHVIRWHAELIDKIYDQVSPASDDHIAMVLREPAGTSHTLSQYRRPRLEKHRM